MSIVYEHRYIGEGKKSGAVGMPVLLTFAKVKNERNGESKPHRHAHLEIFYFESGRSILECEGERREVRAGDIVVVDARVRHCHRPDEKDPPVYCCFAATNVQIGSAVYPDTLTANGFAHLSAGSDKEAAELAELCKNEAERCGKEYLLATTAYFTLLVVHLARVLHGSEPAKEEKNTVSAVKIYIEANFDREFSLDELAARFYVNKSTLLHTFKQAYGTSPLRYRNLCRIECAKKLLMGGASVTAVAMEVGFSNSVYFAEIFRKLTGMPPSAYRKTVCKNT